MNNIGIGSGRSAAIYVDDGWATVTGPPLVVLQALGMTGTRWKWHSETMTVRVDVSDIERMKAALSLISERHIEPVMQPTAITAHLRGAARRGQ